MEKLRRLRVEGFRSLRHVDLELGDRTVLIGANGSGKSNLIEFLRMMRELVHGDLQVYSARKGGASSTLHYGPKRTTDLEIELEFEDKYLPLRYQLSLASAEPDRLLLLREYIYSFTSKGVAESIKTTGGLETSMLPLLYEPIEPSVQSMIEPVIGFLGRVEVVHVHDTTSTSRIRTNSEIHTNDTLKGDGGNVSAFLFMLKAAYPQHYAMIVSTVRLAVPHLVEFILEPQSLNPQAIQLRWRDRNPDYQFGPHQLSDGSLRAIALITLLRQPEELLPSLLVIDEPELGLHPSAIGLIGSLIKAVSAKRQVIVATQSPRLIAEFEPEDIVVVERKEDDQGYGESKFTRLSARDLGDWIKDYDLGTLFEMNVTGGAPQ